MRLQLWLGCLLLCAVATASACNSVEYTNRRQLLLLSESEEIQMGVQAYGEVTAMEPPSMDPNQIAMVQRVGQRIASAADKEVYDWEFKVFAKEQTVNAFCMPGGKVAVYSGILPVAQDDAGLATVLGHEVAHAVARHGGERVSEQLILGLGLAAVQVALRDRNPTTLRTVTGLLGAGMAVGVSLPFSRTLESEADHLGLIFMAKAGYDPHAAKDFWMRMAALSKHRSPEFLSDHPSNETRIQQIEDWLPEAMMYYHPM